MKKIVLALILILDCTNMWGSELLGSDSYDYNVVAFQKTRVLCQDIETPQGQTPESDIDTWGLLHFGVEGAKTGFIFWKPESFKVTPETSDLIHSDGFKSALFACFGNNEAKRKAFTASILGLDFLGHLVGMSIWFFPISFVARTFRKTSWALANPGFIKGMGRIFTVGNRIGMVSLAGVVGYQAYENYESHADSKLRFGELNDSIVDTSKQESDDSFQILQNLLDETNKELGEVKPGDAKEKSLQKRKAILEERLKNHHFATS